MTHTDLIDRLRKLNLAVADDAADALSAPRKERRMPDWKSWDHEPPEPGQKVIIACSDGCSTATALVIDFDGAGTIAALHGEDGLNLTESCFTEGAIWIPLPDEYVLAFTEERFSDYY